MELSLCAEGMNENVTLCRRHDLISQIKKKNWSPWNGDLK